MIARFLESQSKLFIADIENFSTIGEAFICRFSRDKSDLCNSSVYLEET